MINFFFPPKIISIDHSLVLEINAESRVNIIWESHPYWEKSGEDDDAPAANTSYFSVQDKVFESILVHDFWECLNSLLCFHWVFIKSLFLSFRSVISESVHKVSNITPLLSIVSKRSIIMILFYNIWNWFLSF